MVETRLGRDLTDAASDVADRMRCEDFHWTVAAMEIANELGGDLAEILDNVANTIRSRSQVQRKIVAISAEGRISAIILGLLPFPLFLLQFLRNRDYTMLLFNTGLGLGIFAVGCAGLVCGIFWMKRILKLDF